MAAFLAELAEAAGRFDDMRGHVKSLVEQRLRGNGKEEGCQERPERQPTPLSERERNLLSAAYKASLAPRRSALKAISKIIRKEENEGNLDKITCATKYSMRLKAEAEGICCELLQMVQQLVLQTEGSEHIVFYHKMQGDYYRHLAEILEGTAKTKVVKLSRWKYDQAEILAERDLEITNPIRLAVALNYSILIAELDDDHGAARRKARRTYDAALQQLDYIPEDKYKDATLILQLLRDVAQEPLWADQ